MFKKNSVKDDEEDDEDEDEEESEDNSKKSKPAFLSFNLSFLDKLKKKSKKDDDDEDEDEDDDLEIEEEGGKPKRKLSIIHVIVIIGIVWLGMEEFFPTEEPPKAPVLKKIKKNRPFKKKPVEVAEDKPTEAPKPVEDPVEDSIVKDDSPTDNEMGSEEDLDDLFNEDPPIVGNDPVDESKIGEEPSSNQVDNDVDNNDLDFNSEPNETMTDVVDTDNTEPEQPDDFGDQNENTNEVTDVPNPLNQVSDGDIFDDGVIDEVVDPTATPDITDSILKNLEDEIKSKKKAQVLKRATKPTNAPEYEISGRGLVYNCTGKHWACIDSVSFTKCGENYSWNTQSANTVECYPVELYDSVDDCAVIQQFKIDNVESTEFCR